MILLRYSMEAGGNKLILYISTKKDYILCGGFSDTLQNKLKERSSEKCVLQLTLKQKK